MSQYLTQLNEVQKQAVVNTDGPVMVIAGPGSGKTRVLTYRIAYLIQQGVPPWEILALTFTNKAAKEMKARIEKVVGASANRVWAGTFHSIFARILRVEAEKIGYPSSFTIYDSEDTKSLLTNIIKSMNLDPKVYSANGVRSRISSAKSNIIPPKAYAQNEELLSQDRTSKRPMIVKIYEEYVKRCKQAGAMDFDDLLYQLFILLYKNPDNVLEKYRAKFKYILVDEFQDTNFLQYSIVKKLVNYPGSPNNISIVGDDAQSIYAFRGATIENILNFQKDYKAKGLQVFKLEQNYRSTHHIVQAANEVITHNAKQIKKEIWSNKGNGNKIKVIKAMTDAEEGRRIVDQIWEQKNREHLANKDIAILYRTNAQSRVFEEALNRQRIPYKVFGSISFYQRKEVKDLIAYLRLVVNHKDEEALRRVINFPKRGIGKTSIDKVSAIALTSSQSMWESLGQTPLGGRTKTNIDGFQAMILMAAKKQENSNAYDLAKFIAKQSGLQDLLRSDTSMEGLGRMENFDALLDGINDFVENDEITILADGEEEGAVSTDRSLSAYLQNIALLTDMDKESTDEDYVTLMSVHAAKGLEFPSVFVVGLEENLFPSFMALKEGDVDEERRLFYVAITRAERYLTLSLSASRYKYGQVKYNEPSRFLEEIGESNLERMYTPKSKSGQTGNSASSVGGSFKKARPKGPMIAPENFTASAPSKIQAGQKVLHMRFGAGKVIAIDGISGNKIATIFFEEAGQKKIALKFAKLQIEE